MRTLPIHLDRLQAALAAKGVNLKRSSLLEVASAAFGFHSQNQFAAAAKAGDLDAPTATVIGSTRVAGRRIIMLLDAGSRPFCVDETAIDGDRAQAFVATPYGGLADIRNLSDIAPLVDTTALQVQYASITHEYGANLYQDTSEEGLNRQIADWCREYWDQENIGGSYEDLSDEQVIEAYFAEAEEEGVTYFDPMQPPKAIVASDGRSSPYIPDGFAFDAPYLIGRQTGDAEDPLLYWSNDDGWVDSASATVFGTPPASWPTLGLEAGTLFVMPLPALPLPAGQVRGQRRQPEIEFLTNRECDVQGPEDRAAEAMPWIDADEIDVGMGPLRTAEIGYAALVDGEVYLAPTIKAFHFDAEDSMRAMLENRDELQEYADSIEPVIRQVGGMVTLEEDAEAVTLTIYIPLSEARRAADLDAWKEALEDLLTPQGAGERVMARFRPQTMIADSCYDADVQGDPSFDVTYELKLMGAQAIRSLHDHDDAAEELKDAVRAPDWIHQWSGPFGIEVREAAADHYGFDPDDVE